MEREYDVIVAGTGIGGLTVAREMAQRGKSVLMLERGGRTDVLGTTLTMVLILQRFGLMRSREKYVVTFANNYGGLSTLAAGCAVAPPASIFEPFGIDLTEEAEEAKADMHVQTLPDELVGAANMRLMEAAHDAGYNWSKVENFIDPGKCVENCSRCMLGCPHDAKFTARRYGDEALQNGAELKLHTKVTGVVTNNGNVAGVEALRFGKKVTYYGKQVVLSAGLSNVEVLRRAGIDEAGRGFACDWLQFVGAVVPGMHAMHANPMSVGTLEHYETDGIVLFSAFPSWAPFLAILGMMGPRYLSSVPQFWHYSGIMVNIRDEISGEIYEGRDFSKAVTEKDRKKLNKGVDIISRIFKKAGAREESIIALKPLGTRPSASCRIGHVVDGDLQTEIKNLYCCDASVFPAALGLPMVWTVAALGKRLAKHLDNQIESSR